MKPTSLISRSLLCGILTLTCLGARAQTTPAQPKPVDATGILTRCLDVYANAKSYQSSWTYLRENGKETQKLTVEVKSKGPTRVYFRLAPAPGQKQTPDADPIPEMLVVLDGKNAYFVNATSNIYYKVALPKNPLTSPLMFFPLIRATSEITRGTDLQADGKTYFVLTATTPNNGQSRMEIEASTYHIKRIIQEEPVGLTKSVSTISIDKEAFGPDLPDSAFNFKPAKNAKEIPAPAEAVALFGPTEAAPKSGGASDTNTR